MSVNSVNGSTGSGERWSWSEAAWAPITGAEATAWWQLATISTSAGVCWSIGGSVITHSTALDTFYMVMAVYLLAAIRLYGLGPVSRYGIAKTSVVAIVAFALPAVSSSVPLTLVAMVVALLSARAAIGVAEREASCFALPGGMI